LGWTAGGGVEYALSWNWFIKAEYLYVSFSNQTAAQVVSAGPPRDRNRHRQPDGFHRPRRL
jgi:opacity protein-like surface antigen